jgi:hypothetical protein
MELMKELFVELLAGYYFLITLQLLNIYIHLHRHRHRFVVHRLRHQQLQDIQLEMLNLIQIFRILLMIPHHGYPLMALYLFLMQT